MKREEAVAELIETARTAQRELARGVEVGGMDYHDIARVARFLFERIEAVDATAGEVVELPPRRIPVGIALLRTQRLLKRVVERVREEMDLRHATVLATVKLADKVVLDIGTLRLMLDVVLVGAGDDAGGVWSHEVEDGPDGAA